MPSFDFGFATLTSAPNLSEQGKRAVASMLTSSRRAREAAGMAPTAESRHLEATMQATIGREDEALKSYIEAIDLLESERAKCASLFVAARGTPSFPHTERGAATFPLPRGVKPVHGGSAAVAVFTLDANMRMP